jgi:DNA-binding NarL/FixJ family response regulator
MGEFGEAHRQLASVKARIMYPPDRAFAAAVDALCLALGDNARESGAAVEEALTVIDQARPEVGGFGSTIFETASLFCALAEALSGRHTAAQRILKRSSLSAHRSMECLREATAELARAARSQTYAADDIEGRAEVLRNDGFGGYARYLALAAKHVEAGHEVEETIRLTPSELRILRLLAAGMAPKDVAAEMGRSVYTVQTHIQNLIEKLGCHGRAEAIAAARRMGLLDEAL